MSTPELLGAQESGLVGGIGDAPGVDDQRHEAKEVSGHRNGMQARQLFGGMSPLLLRHASIFDLVNLTDFWRENFLPGQPEAQHQDDQPEGEPPKRPSGIDHLGKEMSEGDDAADEVDGEITADQVLGDHARVVVAEDALHVGAERGRRNSECEKEGRPQPDGRIEGSDNAQNDEHVRDVIGWLQPSQATMRRNPFRAWTVLCL